jgi:Spy/CpxP family protein refolding chaperone
MNTKRTLLKIAAATSAFAVIAGGLTLWNVSGADAAVRGRLSRFQGARETHEAVRAILTEEQRAVLDAFRAESKDLRADRRAFLNEQRDLLADFNLSPEQWEQLSGVVDIHGQAVVDAAMRVVDSRVALRDATLAQDGSEEAIRNAAASAGTAMGDAAVVLNAAIEAARAVLTPEQQAMLNTVVDNVTGKRDENRFAIAERMLELRSDLGLTGAQKAAIAEVIREALGRMPLDLGSEF